MVDEGKKSSDILGLAPYGEAINTLARGAVDGASSFLSRICLPAAEEFGLLLRDKVGAWRANNAVKIVLKSEKIYEKHLQGKNMQAHPRLVMKVLEEGSWAEDEKIQEMWAGLLASACSEDGKDETNLIFMNILSQITSAQASILNYACETCKKSVSQGGWIEASQLILDLDEIKKITAVPDIHRLDRELDHLRSLDLLDGGFFPYSTEARVTPRALALHMYARCKGYKGSPIDFYGIVDERNE